MSQDHILEFWEKQAISHGTHHSASWGDHWAIDLEVDVIANQVRPGMDILDVGCSNGHATLRHLGAEPASLTGIDFAPAMVDAAIRNAEQTETSVPLDFRVGDVRKLEFDDASFDLVYTTRVLINLPTWDEQLQGIRECIRVCRPGGKVVLCEGFWEPLVLLNAMRTLVELPPLVEHDFNRYLKKSRLEAWLAEQSHEYEVDEFSSIYYLGSRFVRELVTDPSAYPGYENPVNGIFHEIEKRYSGGGMGIQQAYIVSC